MSEFVVLPDEMGKDPNLAEEELQALLDGHPATATGDLGRFVDDLRATFPAEAPAAQAHLAAIMETTQLFADNGDPVARPVSNADAPVPQVSRLPKRRENHMKERRLRVLVLRVAAPLVALFTVLGIMGSAGALPRGLQRLTSHAAGLVGFELPSGEDAEGDFDDQGEDLDDQGEDLDDQGEDTKDDSAAVEDDQGEDTQDDSTTVGEDDQGEDTQDDSTTVGEDDQGEDTQDDSTTVDSGDGDSQDEDDQGSTTNEDDQGDNSQDETSGGSGQDDQGDNAGDSSGDSGSGDNNQN